MTAARTPQHGTSRRYDAGCRCKPCTNAYERNRVRQIAYGRWAPFTDAEPVREHLRALSAAGIGSKSAARLAGVSEGAVHRILYGRPAAGEAPARKVRHETAARILAVRAESANLRPGATVDATGSKRRIQALAANGFPVRHLAQRLGYRHHQNLAAVLQAVSVQARRAWDIADLYEDLWNADPAACGVAAPAVTRTRNWAKRQGWVRPMAWAGVDIDDAAAEPDTGASVPRPLALAEDVEFITRTTGVADRDLIAARLGVARGTLDRNLERANALRRGELVAA